MKVQILLFDGFEEMDVIGVYQALRMAGLAVRLVSFEQQAQIHAFQGLTVVPDGVFALEELPDLLIVPGGGWLARAEKGAWALAGNEQLLAMLRAVHAAGIILASVCTGAMLLGRANLLKDRPATTNHAALEDLKAMGACIVNARVVDDGDIITAGGITSSLDLGLWLIERFIGCEKALEISKSLEFEQRGPIWKSSQNC
jgi:transcriptional regulator GlxA family with amidase domain